jgi:hypothetical protein
MKDNLGINNIVRRGVPKERMHVWKIFGTPGNCNTTTTNRSHLDMKNPHMIIEVAIFNLDKFYIHNLNVDDHLRGSTHS